MLLVSYLPAVSLCLQEYVQVTQPIPHVDAVILRRTLLPVCSRDFFFILFQDFKLLLRPFPEQYSTDTWKCVPLADIGPAGCSCFAEALVTNSTIANFDISWNGIEEEAGIKFGEMLLRNTRLKRLNMSNCRITFPAAKVIAESLKFNSTLSSIDLSNNPLGKCAYCLLRLNVYDFRFRCSYYIVCTTHVVISIQYGHMLCNSS